MMTALRKNTLRRIWITLLILSIPGSSFAEEAKGNSFQQQEPLIVGVLDLETNNVDAGEAAAISERLRLFLGQQPAFIVIERQRMSEIMDEVGFQFSGACDTDECVIQVGRILGARKMVAGSVSRVGTIYSIQVRIIDIETTRIEHQAMSDVNGIEEAFQIATQDVARQLAQNVAGQGGVSRLDTGNPMVITTGQIRIVSTPVGAEITVDGTVIGNTPRTLALEEGTHELVLTRDGYVSHTDSLEVAGGENRTIDIPLNEIPTGNVRFVVNPSAGVTVLVDGEEQGVTPTIRTLRLYQGQHTVELRMDGYDTYTQDVVIRAGITDELNVTLVRSGSAQLSLSSALRGAAVSVSGTDQKYSLPADEITLRPGDYTIKVKARGYSVWQESITLENGDNQTVPVILRAKSRAGAGVLSLLIPGGGQFYSRRPGMGTLMLIGGGVLGYLAYSENTAYGSIRDEHAEIQQLYDEAATSYDVTLYRQLLVSKADEMETSRKKLTTWAGALGGLWLLNVLDAYARMPRLPRVGGIQPSLSAQTVGNRITFSLKVAF
ncbi:PEGA domain-containing protein [Gemmatimonadota bacterium]